MRTIDADELKKAIAEKFDDFIPEGVYDEIDNAPTISEGFYEAFCRMNDAELEHTERLSFSNSKGEIVGFVKERPHGKWKHHEEYTKDRPFYVTECPFCKLRVQEKTNYCPNCGAKMQKGGAE